MKWSSVQTENTIIQYNECFIYNTNKRSRNFRDTYRKNYDTKEITMPRISTVKVKDYVKKIGET